jgi:hypothetical protein
MRNFSKCYEKLRNFIEKLKTQSYPKLKVRKEGKEE